MRNYKQTSILRVIFISDTRYPFKPLSELINDDIVIFLKRNAELCKFSLNINSQITFTEKKGIENKQFLAKQIQTSHPSFIRQRFEGYHCESSIPL